MTQTSPDSKSQNQNMEANFSTLILSIGSSAAMSLGIAPNPATGKIEKNLEVARFNIELLRMLRQKTANNLTGDEQKFLDSVTSDLQLKFVQISK